MNGGKQENAMTEIALAMAMGFFSVMVLTVMSMGVTGPIVNSSALKAVTVVIADSAPSRATGTADKVTDKDLLVVFDGRSFFGSDLKEINVGAIDGSKRVVLAVTPELSMVQAIEARQKINAPRLVITTLDRNWRRAVRERSNAL